MHRMATEQPLAMGCRQHHAHHLSPPGRTHCMAFPVMACVRLMTGVPISCIASGAGKGSDWYGAPCCWLCYSSAASLAPSYFSRKAVQALLPQGRLCSFPVYLVGQLMRSPSRLSTLPRFPLTLSIWAGLSTTRARISSVWAVSQRKIKPGLSPLMLAARIYLKPETGWRSDRNREESRLLRSE